jgi:hypothetical protein
MQWQRPTLSRGTVRIGLFVLAAVAALAVAELTSEGFSEFTRDHALISTFITEAVLLVGVYLVIDEIIERRQTRRWSDVTALGIRALAPLADRPAEIVRSLVDRVVPTGGDVDYEELVSDHADELGDWLRADGERSRLFAEETRRSASRLEEAIIRWGPTLVEDAHSAELLNLLPDVVDSARSAAEVIAPAPAWREPVHEQDGTGSAADGWTEEGRKRFEDSLLEILKNVVEFDRKCSA